MSSRITKYLEKGQITTIVETEIPRYMNFFENSYKENLDHANFVLNNFPRWSIISGYYAMHDITKLFLAGQFRIKIEFKVHETTIDVLKELTKDKEILKLLKTGYSEFIAIANDLAKAKKERIKAQYYTGSDFSKEKYKERANSFLKNVVNQFIEKITRMMKK